MYGGNYFQGTIFPAPSFDPVMDAQMLIGALQGMECDKDVLINILTQRCNAQRLMIAEAYRNMYGKDLLIDLKESLSHHFKEVMVGLMYPPASYDAHELWHAMKGADTEENCLIDVLASRSNGEIFQMKEAYLLQYNTDLSPDIYSETSGHFRDTLLNLAQGTRQEGYADPAMAAQDAMVLWEACQQKTGEHKTRLQMILCNKSYQQLWMVFQEFQNISGQDIIDAIKECYDGYFQELLVAIVLCVRDKASYFAYRLYNAIHDIRNTVGNIPMEWYQDFPHIGYDLDGKKIYKPIRTKDELDKFLEKMENPEYWRTINDKKTGVDVKLTDEQVELVNRLQQGQFGDVNFNPYEPSVDFFSSQVMIHPVTNRPADKRSFIPSLIEKEKVSRLVHAIKMGWIKPRKPKEETPAFYDLWAQEDPNSILGRHKMHVPAPKLPLPGHEESYNPPPEYLPTEEEKLAWEQQEPSERKLSFLPQRYEQLRRVPAFPHFIHERFERCLDLYLCPRQRKMRVSVDPEDLIPKLPKPRDLQPFPTVQALVYRGHTSIVRCLSVSPSGQWLASGSDDGTVKFWEVCTARCMKTLPVQGCVKSVAWNPNPTVCLVAIAVEQLVLLVNPGLGDKLLYGATDQLLESYMPPEEERPQPVKWEEADGEDRAWGVRLIVRHGKPLKQVTWHGKGDYFATVVSDNSHLQVLIHQASKRWSQAPFRRSKGQVQRVLFHPLRPFFFVATQRFVRVYNLLKQELTKKLLTNCKWVSSIAVHPGGDNLICGSYDSKLAWFDLDLSTKPYRVLRHHKAALRAVAFHLHYPLFASGSDDGSVIVCHGMVYNDLLQNPLIVPVKVLKGHTLTHDLGVLDVLFHPSQPWLFSAGADATIRLFT